MKFNQAILLLASVTAIRVSSDSSTETPEDQAKEIFRQFDANVDEFVTRDEVNKGIDNLYETKMTERDQELAKQKKLHVNALKEDFQKIAKIDLRDLTTLLTGKHNIKVAAEEKAEAEAEAARQAELERQEAEAEAARQAEEEAAQQVKLAAAKKAEEEAAIQAKLAAAKQAKEEAARQAIIDSQSLVTKPLTLLKENGYCDLKGGKYKKTRMTYKGGHTVKSCNALCLKTKGCKKFQFGNGQWKGRCDLFNSDVCQWNPSAFTFDWYTPSEANQVREPTSHFSKENPKGCGSKTHPQNYLGIRRVGTQAQCTAECFKTKDCFSFNMHRGSHCHLYSQDYKCGPNSQQDKYYMDYKPAITQ